MAGLENNIIMLLGEYPAVHAVQVDPPVQI